MSPLHFLVDVQLPPALARWLTDRGSGAVHAYEIDLGRAQDTDICQRAHADGRIVVTKDADFLTLAGAHEPPVRLLWVRVGNMATPALLDRFADAWPQISDALQRGELVVELR